MRTAPACLMFLMGLATTPLLAQTPEAGRTTSVTGIVALQRADGSVSIAARGSAVRPGDTVLTQPDSRAVIELRDGAQLTVRPGSELRIEGYRFLQGNPEEDSTVLRLIKGGLRTITGLLGQRRPKAFQLSSGVATIGVRGTDFVARACEDDCAQESRRDLSNRVSRTPGYVARVASIEGRLVTASGARAGKPLSQGDPVYSEDLLDTGSQSTGTLVFQDGTRIVLQENTRFSVERFRYEPSRPDQGNVVFRLLKGSLRALTGLVARSNNRQFQVNTAVATIGVRGTGFDILCAGTCAYDGEPAPADAPQGLTLVNWEGCNVVANGGGETEACQGQSVNTASKDTAPARLDAAPPFFERQPGQRPDSLRVDLNELFGLQKEDFSEPGIYVQVREGTVILKGSSTETFSLAKGEVGYVDGSGQKFLRLGVVPAFLDRDVFMRDADPADYGCFLK